MRKIWYCEKCDVEASCTIPKGADVYDGVNRLAASHMKKSANCHTEHKIGWVRIKAPGCSMAEWRQVRENARIVRLAAIKAKFIIPAAALPATEGDK